MALIVLLLIHPAQLAAAAVDNAQDQALIQVFGDDNDDNTIVTALDDSIEEDEELLLEGRMTLATSTPNAKKR